MAIFPDPDGNQIVLHRRYAPSQIERTDFIAVPVQDSRARRAVLRRGARPDEEPELDRELAWEYETAERHARVRRSRDDRAGRSRRSRSRRSSLRVADLDEARAEARGRRRRARWATRSTRASAACSPFTDTEGNGLMLHHRYAAYPDGTMNVDLDGRHRSGFRPPTWSARASSTSRRSACRRPEGASPSSSSATTCFLYLIDPKSIGGGVPHPHGTPDRAARRRRRETRARARGEGRRVRRRDARHRRLPHGALRRSRRQPASCCTGGTRRMSEVTRVDYIRVPVDDIEAAQHFYGEILGLPRNEHLDHDDWIEYEASNVTLAVMTPETHDDVFAASRPGRSRSASPTSPPRRPSSRRRASRSARCGTRASAAAPASAIRPATGSSSTTGTRPYDEATHSPPTRRCRSRTRPRSTGASPTCAASTLTRSKAPRRRRSRRCSTSTSPATRPSPPTASRSRRRPRASRSSRSPTTTSASTRSSAGTRSSRRTTRRCGSTASSSSSRRASCSRSRCTSASRRPARRSGGSSSSRRRARARRSSRSTRRRRPTPRRTRTR